MDGSLPLTFEETRRQADEALAAGHAADAMALYERYAAACAKDDPTRGEALLVVAQLREEGGAEQPSWLPIYLELFETSHEGAVKALARVLEAARIGAAEADVRVDPVPAERLHDLVAKMPSGVPGRADALALAHHLYPESLFVRAGRAYDARLFAESARLYQECARTAGTSPLAVQACCRAAAILWNQLADGTGTLRCLATLGPAAALQAEAAVVLDRALTGLKDQLGTLVRRGDRRGAFEMLQRIVGSLPPGNARAEDLMTLYLKELSSFYLTFVVERVEAVGRRIDGVSGELARKCAQGRADKLDEVEARWRLYALNEEREMLMGLKKTLEEWELTLLGRLTAGAYVDLLEASRQDATFRDLLDLIHRLSLERMHYKIGFRSEIKDKLLAWLPAPVSRRLVDDVYIRVQELTGDLDRRCRELYSRVYAVPAQTAGSADAATVAAGSASAAPPAGPAGAAGPANSSGSGGAPGAHDPGPASPPPTPPPPVAPAA